ncbi:MAG TPA: TonB family protein, partial [Cellvibrionaceae bacterium]|nr:TonB family protein [Cellvibrionaceae bacterium]
DAKAILLDESDQRMEVRVLAGSLLGNRFKRMWIEGVAINAGTGEMAKHSQNLADFSNLMSIKLQRDDILSIARQGNATVVRVNNLELGKIPSGEFYNLLLRTWIGPVPLSSSFRDGLLTSGKVDEKTISIYSKISPTPERIAVIRAALIAAGKNKGKPTEVAAAKPEPAKVEPVAKVEPPVKEVAKTEPPVKEAVKEVAKVEAVKPVEKAPVKPEAQEPSSPAATATAAAPVAAAAQAASQVAKAATPAASAPKPAAAKANEVFEEEEKQETADSLLVQQLYIAKLSKRTAGFVKYPKSALSKEQEGTVRLAITINRSGQVTNVKSSSTNEVPVLTQAAVEAANRASPYPAIPEQIKSDSFTFTIPITFRVRDR